MSNVSTWLGTLPSSIDQFVSPNDKRTTLLTPPAMTPSSPSKRLRQDASTSSAGRAIDSDVDIDATFRRPMLPPTAAFAREVGSAMAGSSSLTGSSVEPRSRTKRKRKATATPHTTKAFTTDSNVPISLRDMWLQIEEFSDGVGVIPASEKDNINKLKDSEPIMQRIKHLWYFDETPSWDRLGPVPSPDRVIDMIKRSTMCADNEFDESGWNMSLHCRVINLAVPELCQGPGKLVYMVPCTSAKILPELAQAGLSRKVDFCLCVEPTGAAAQAIQRWVPMEIPSINHTDHGALRTRPIGLSIETKLEGERFSVASAQLLSWHTYQWTMLDKLTSGIVPSPPLPDFLPGIIIQGTSWRFVASTRKDGIVTLWHSVTIGSTCNALGVYQVVCVLQYLVSWIKGTYWPWFQRVVLSINPEDTELGM